MVLFYLRRNAIHGLINIWLWRATYVLVDGTTWAGFCSPGTPPWVEKKFNNEKLVCTAL